MMGWRIATAKLHLDINTQMPA